MEWIHISAEDGTGSNEAFGLQILVFSLVAGATIAWCFFTQRRRKSSQKRWVPMIPGVGMLETIRGFAGNKSPMFILELAKKAGCMTFRFNLPIGGRSGVYAVGDGALARKILLDPTTDKSIKMGSSIEQFFEGRKSMFTCTNTDYMKTLRKGTMQAFSNNQVRRMSAVALKYVNELVDDRIPNYIAKEEGIFDPAYEMSRMTFQTICEAAFEFTDGTDEEYHKIVEHLEVGLREFFFRQMTNPVRAKLGFIIPSVLEAHKSANAVRDYARKILKAYQARQDQEKSSEQTLIRLVKENKAVEHDEEQKVVELTTWLIAGHDTTGFSLSNMLVLLAKHPLVQEKLRTACAKGKTDPHTINYFQCVIKEASRLIPVASMGSVRTTRRDFATKEGCIIPAGALCFLTQYHGNRDPSIFEQPDDFVPERWENPTKTMLDQFMPFSVGPRNCPGQALANAEINATLPRLLKHYSFEIVDEGELTFFLTLKYVGARLKAIKL